MCTIFPNEMNSFFFLFFKYDIRGNSTFNNLSECLLKIAMIRSRLMGELVENFIVEEEFIYLKHRSPRVAINFGM